MGGLLSAYAYWERRDLVIQEDEEDIRSIEKAHRIISYVLGLLSFFIFVL